MDIDLIVLLIIAVIVLVALVGLNVAIRRDRAVPPLTVCEPARATREAIPNPSIVIGWEYLSNPARARLVARAAHNSTGFWTTEPREFVIEWQDDVETIEILRGTWTFDLRFGNVVEIATVLDPGEGLRATVETGFGYAPTIVRDAS